MKVIGDRYEVLHLLGSGGVADVYRVRDQNHAGRIIALKRPRNAHHNASLHAEYCALAEAHHPHLVSVYEYYADLGDGMPGYTLEEVNGQPADRVVDECGPNVVGPIAVSLLRAIAHIHAQGLTHGDIHPHNVIVAMDEEAPSSTVQSVKLLDLVPTRIAGAMGALPFLAPERLEGDESSVASDLFATGVTLHRLLTGTLPFPNYPVKYDPDRPQNAEKLGLWTDLVRSLLSKEPTKRPLRATDVLASIANLSHTDYSPVTSTSVRTSLTSGATLGLDDWLGPIVDWGHKTLDDSGHGVQYIVGVRGSGRTQVLRDIRRNLEVRTDVRILRCDAGSDAQPFDAIRTLIRQIRSSDVIGIAAELTSVMSQLSAGTIRGGDSGKSAPQTTEYMGDQLGELLIQCTQRRAIAIIVDDLDRIDPDSRKVLETLIRWQEHRPADVGTLWMCVSVETSHAPGQDSTCVRQAHIPLFSSVDTWLRRTFAGLIPTKALVDSVGLNTGDIPASIAGTLQQAIEKEWLSMDATSIGLAPNAPVPLPIPDSEHGNLLTGLEQLTHESKHVLQLASAVPVPIPLPFVSSCLKKPDGQTTQLIDRLCTRRLLQWDQCAGEDVVRVPSQSLATAISQRLGPPENVPTIDEQASTMMRIAAVAVAFSDGNGSESALVDIASEMLGLGLVTALLSLIKHVPEEKRTASLYRYHGDALAVLGQIEEAAEAYNHLDTPQRARLQAVLYCRHGRFAEAVALLKELKATDADTLRWLAVAQIKLGNHTSAPALCAKARAAAKNPLAHARIDYVEGLALFYAGQYSNSRAFLERATAVFDSEHRRVEEAETLVAHGLLFYRENDMHRAMRSFEHAMDIATKCGDRHRVMNTLMNLAVVHQERGEYELAEVRYREAYDMSHIMDHRAGRMQSGFNLSNLNRFLGRLDLALDYAQESITLAKQSGNQYVHAASLSILGEISWLRNDTTGSCEQLSRAVTMLEALGIQRELADALHSLAKAQMDANQMDNAQRNSVRARDIAEEHGLTDMQIRTHVLQSEIARLNGDGKAALQHAAKASELHRPGGRPEMEWTVHYSLFKAASSFGDRDEAMVHANRALQAIEAVANGLSHDLRKSFLALKDRALLMEELSNTPSPVFESDLREETEEGMQHSRQLSRLLDINRRLTSELNLDRLLEYIIDSAILLTDAERGFIVLADSLDDDESISVSVVVARNIDQENIRKKKDKVSYSIAQNVLNEGEAVLTTDAMHDERYNQYRSIHAMKLRSVLCLPMMVKGQAIGALYLDNRFQKGAFSEQDLAVMDAFASQASIAISNARLLAEREDALTELDRSRQKVEVLNQQLEQELAEKALALETSERVIVAQGKQLGRVHGYENIIGESPKIRTVIHMLDRVASSEVSVLVTGESGTGKELVARAVHYNGPRKSRPFVAINCSSIPDNLIESELFGHVRGAFTGATRDRQGVFEVADGGTLFLDEIGDMPLDMQAKLLRSLQDGQIQKVGSSATHTVDVRFIAATHRNLRDMIKNGSFREDLYYRLAVITLELPPLRERKEDIPILMKHFLKANADESLSHVTDVSTPALRLLMSYDWPGNVRELAMALKNASVFSESDTLQPVDFSNFPGISDSQTQVKLPTTTGTVQPLAELEKQAIIHALEMNHGNKKRTAEQLGIDRRTLYNKLATYGISIERQAQLRSPDPS